jgi:hypothetical protein
MLGKIEKLEARKLLKRTVVRTRAVMHKEKAW